MSIKKAKQFLLQITEDEAAALKAEQAHVQALLSVAKDLGYPDLDADELRQAMDEMASLGQELSDERLEGVAGGGGLLPGLPDRSIYDTDPSMVTMPWRTLPKRPPPTKR